MTAHRSGRAFLVGRRMNDGFPNNNYSFERAIDLENLIEMLTVSRFGRFSK